VANGVSEDAIVGTSTDAGDVDSLAFIWTRSKGMVDLNTLIPANSGWVLVTANSINGEGRIVGTGTINGASHAFLLTGD